MDREWDDVRAMGFYAPIPNKWGTRNEATRGIPVNDLNNILVGWTAVDWYIQTPAKLLDDDVHW